MLEKYLFLFHTGSIKSSSVPVKRSTIGSFLFHTGSIKSSSVPVKRSTIGSFLFHTGSIKRRLRGADRHRRYSFYSILVRLKDWAQTAFREVYNVSIPYWFD